MNMIYPATMKRRFLLAFIFMVFVTAVQAANNQKCIIIGFEPRNIKVSDSISDALKDSGLGVEKCMVSRKGISFTVDSLLETLGNSSDAVGIIGVGYVGGIAAAEMASKSSPAYLILISTPAISGKRYSERILMGSTFYNGFPPKEASAVREILKEMPHEDNIISKEIGQYLPEKIFPSINCPVFALTGANDARLDWYENLSELERILPKSENNLFRVYPQTGYVLLEEKEYFPFWIVDYSPYAIANINAQAIQDICNWITDLQKR